MGKRPQVAAGFLLAGLLAHLFLPASAKANATQAAERPRVFALQRFRKALWTVRVTVNGKLGSFLFDTGGGNTLVTRDFAAGLGCDFWGRTTGYNMFGKRDDGPHCDDVRIVADGVALTPVNVGTIDFGDRFAGDKSPDGLLSLDAFDGRAITIDQIAATVTIETAASLAMRTRKMTEVPLRVSRECSARCLSVFVGVPTPRGLTWLILDSGAGGVSLISKEYADVFGLSPTEHDQHLTYQIAPGIRVDSPVIVTDMIMDGNLGQPFMSRYLISLDLARSRAWFAPAPSSTAPIP